MTEVVFEPGATEQDVADALRALSARLAADTPVLALGGRRSARAGQAVFASSAIMHLFDAATLSDLSETLARPPRAAGPRVEARQINVSAAERLCQLAAALPPNGPARLERLRFEFDGADHAITFLCRRLAVDGAAPLFIAAALDPPSALALRAAKPGSERGAAPLGPAGGETLRFLWRTGADDRMVEVDPRLTERAGAAGADLIGRRLSEAIARLDPQVAARLAERLERRESFSGVEIVWPGVASAAGVPVVIAGTPGFDSRRNFTGYRGFGVVRFDALAIEGRAPAGAGTTRQSAAGAPARTGIDADLRHYQREARELTAILDTAMDGVAVLDAQGRIVGLNKSGEALFGYEKAEVAGAPFATLIAPESRERVECYLEGLRSNGVASLLNDGREILGLTRQGGAIPLFMTLGRIGGESDHDARYCALLRDMTHWKTVERELDEARREAERASALKSDFLAKVSHEIRTPLNAVLGFAEVMMEERFGPIGNARYRDYLKDIHSSGALVLSLVNDLLDLSKIEAGKMELAFEAVDANRVVTECVSIMQTQASAARVVVRLSLAPQLPDVCADQRSMRQIVLNLLSNAIKFTQPGGQVIVSTALTDENHAALRIRDTGVGMSDGDIEIALEPFRQVASSRLAGGTGLGLPLTKALVEANRASFSIRSKVREGTLVEVVFPPARVVAARG
jgi:PAS domain S-box-containing protein